MDRERILASMSELLADIFDDDALVVDRSTSAAEVEAWDSLNHVNVVAAVEEAFDIQFTLNEMRELQNVGEMVDVIYELVNE